MANMVRTTLLLGAMTVLIVLIGRMFGGPHGMVLALVLAAVMNFGSYWFSDKIVLQMYRAQPIDRRRAPELYNVVEELAANAEIPMPKLYLIPNEAPNAFATGRNPQHAVVAVTEGLLRQLSLEEVRGVLAHELAHVKNRDILIGTIAATMAGVVMILANMAQWAAFFGGGRGSDDEGGGGVVGLLVTAILAPIAATLIQMAVSRSREYQADASGARFARNPESLASALEKLARGAQRIPMHNAKPATAHMFIVNPLRGKSMASLFSTHPPIEERIRRLRSMR